MKLDENSIDFYQSIYMLPSLRGVVSYKGFLQKSNNQKNSFLFKIQHRILSKRVELGDWIEDSIKLDNKENLEKNVYEYLKKFYKKHFD